VKGGANSGEHSQRKGADGAAMRPAAVKPTAPAARRLPACRRELISEHANDVTSLTVGASEIRNALRICLAKAPNRIDITDAIVQPKDDDFNSVAKLARSGNRFERRMPRAESCARIMGLAFLGITN
jgi:hypothetical protein